MAELDLGGGVWVLRPTLFDDELGVWGLDVEGVNDLRPSVSSNLIPLL